MTFTSLCSTHSQQDSKRSDSEGDLIPLKILHTKPPIPSCTSLGGEARNFIKLNPCTTKQLLQLFLPKEDQRFIKFSFIIPNVPLFFSCAVKNLFLCASAQDTIQDNKNFYSFASVAIMRVIVSKRWFPCWTSPNPFSQFDGSALDLPAFGVIK